MGSSLFRVLLLAGVVVKFWWVILAVLGALVLLAALLIARSYRHQRVLERDAENAKIVARADEQHAQILAGDGWGVYGEYLPEKLTHGVRRGVDSRSARFDGFDLHNYASVINCK